MGTRIVPTIPKDVISRLRSFDPEGGLEQFQGMNPHFKQKCESPSLYPPFVCCVTEPRNATPLLCVSEPMSPPSPEAFNVQKRPSGEHDGILFSRTPPGWEGGTIVPVGRQLESVTTGPSGPMTPHVSAPITDPRATGDALTLPSLAGSAETIRPVCSTVP